jgi:hypothetical protein
MTTLSGAAQPVLHKPGDRLRGLSPGDARLLFAKSVERLSCDLGDELKVFVDVQDRKVADFGRCRDEKVGERWCAVLTSLGESKLYLECPFFDRWSEMLNEKCRNWG